MHAKMWTKHFYKDNWLELIYEEVLLDHHLRAQRQSLIVLYFKVAREV